MKPTVTVLMSAYNAEAYIADSVNSILNQSFTDFEFIIINDGSTDSTGEYLSEIEKRDHRIKYIINEKNIGLAGALNKGLRLSKGKYIVRMDADDVSLPNRIQKQVTYMDSNPEIGVSSGWILSFGEKSTVWKCPEIHDQIWTRMFFRNSLWHPAVIFRNGILKNYNFEYDENYERSQDYDLWSKMASVTKFGNLQEVILKYRLHENQVSKIEGNSIRIRLRLAERFLGRNLSEQEKFLHKLLFSAFPECSNDDVKQLDDWLLYLKSVNRKNCVYKENYFNTLLDKEFKKFNRKKFYVEISKYARYRPSFIKYLLQNRCRLFFSIPVKEIVKIIAKSLLYYPNNFDRPNSYRF